MAVCEDCWKEAGRRQSSGDARPQAEIYEEVLKDVARAGDENQGCSWCIASLEFWDTEE
jgi:hypothetical protein